MEKEIIETLSKEAINQSELDKLLLGSDAQAKENSIFDIEQKPRIRNPRRYTMLDKNKREVPIEVIQTPLTLSTFNSIKIDVNAWIKELTKFEI